MWNNAITLKAPKTPSARAITTGTPYLGKPYLRGLYARDVLTNELVLCSGACDFYELGPWDRRGSLGIWHDPFAF